MTECERQLQEMALSIQEARREAGCESKVTVPEPSMDAIPNLGGEARSGDCLVSMLASGSKGNAAYIRCGKTNILIDAGISCRRIEKGLKRYGCALGDLDAVFITHEHSDHVGGLATLLKRTDMPIYTTAETWQAMGRKTDGFDHRFVRLTRRVALKDIEVTPFAISHDAARPVGYSLRHGDAKITLATDLGYVSPDVAAAAAYADILVLESNHDEEMVRNGPYPYALQQRILGRWGHLSNKTAAAFWHPFRRKASCGSFWLTAVRRITPRLWLSIRCGRCSPSPAASWVKIFYCGWPAKTAASAFRKGVVTNHAAQTNPYGHRCRNPHRRRRLWGL